MTDTTTDARPHCATFSDTIVDHLRARITAEAERVGRALHVLDPFAGVGTVHQLPGYTLGVELEPEWAGQWRDQSPTDGSLGTIVGDSTKLADIVTPGSVDVVATSPCYGNRMADTYDGAGRCTKCNGDGAVWAGAGREPETCPRCGGEGRDTSKRATYTIALGRQLTEGNAGAMQWGPAYRKLHEQVWQQVDQVLVPGGLVLVNVSNHYRGGELVRVVEWHLGQFLAMGYGLVEARRIPTKRMRFGANHELRVDGEMVLAMRRPDVQGRLL